MRDVLVQALIMALLLGFALGCFALAQPDAGKILIGVAAGCAPGLLSRAGTIPTPIPPSATTTLTRTIVGEVTQPPPKE